MNSEKLNRVTCATKKGDNYNPYERISHIGGYNSKGEFFKITSEEAILLIDDKKYYFCVVKDGKNVQVITATRNGRKYLKTEADAYEPNNLLALGDCPP